ncbi:hypothetical protein LTR91_021765 [Friedmanniomyces endolithicus]|uniref:DUF155 domain-containing protein n=1 Tax=Friedmanniomyces endolithicus TaxID=329885 RepID=A0AAN6H7I5_9PEZI|nr:hypothetical protein LTR57_014676 [Friedmanniomyces endolithicus]KAK0957671.1 hypothetical protein LTR91_021765 [Friedmanniomyces endolithicus]KAK0986862.1 hypothetical protein LTS01_009806 [Friedmanniomyces endolithicus]KAK1048063.1 hypothetical protein LTS16_004585 [Friedmanniomyces endolithicus]
MRDGGDGMASKAATWIAFGALFKRGFTTKVPARSCHNPKPQPANRTRIELSGHPQRRPGLRRHFLVPRTLRQQDDSSKKPAGATARRKTARTEARTASLKRLAIEAQRSRQVIQGSGRRAHVNPDLDTRNVTAYCAAETYNIHLARDILIKQGYVPDPFNTGLYPQVLHLQTPEDASGNPGDVFVLPSGTVVTWNVSEMLGRKIVERWLPRAAEDGHLDKLEAEDMEYLEEPSRDVSRIIGDTIILGTKPSNAPETPSDLPPTDTAANPPHQRHDSDTVLAKMAFSSALARSTKLAVLESRLTSYFATTRNIPTTLSRGTRLRFSRAFILQKTGELLNIRAQLNLYSELTDSLPDLFWDSPHELGLESYYEKAGRALDVGSRIRVLNEKMDYASEIAAVLRERLSEKHSTELEWLIIGLISIEVGFGILQLWREREVRRDPEATETLVREFLRRELRRA